MLRRFDLNRDNSSIQLHQKIHFITVISCPIIAAMTASNELVADIVLRHAALEVVQIMGGIQDILRNDFFLRAQQPYIGHISLERVNVPIVL